MMCPLRPLVTMKQQQKQQYTVKKKCATDRTRYGATRISTKSFYTHHGQMLVKAAVVNDALAINKNIVSQRQKLHHDSEMGVAHAAMPGEEDA